MYVHTHWSYNAPYAARTWTLHQWKEYLRGLSRLGYNLVQIWPMLDTMPVPPTPSDIEHLEKLRSVIRFAHDNLGMTVYVGIGPNTSANDKAASFHFNDRNYFETETLIDPADDLAFNREMERRRVLLEPLSEADGLWILDCDPGGWKGSPVSEFIGILARHRRLLDDLRPGIRLIYWMWAGWTDIHDFSPEATSHIQPFWLDTLKMLADLNPEPWALHACMLGHFKTIKKLDLQTRAHFFPYNVVEYEPSYPFTNWAPERIACAFDAVANYKYTMGVLGNSQTHCLQIPHAYVFSHIARGGTMENLDVAAFGERLTPGYGRQLAHAWQALSLENNDPNECRKAALNLPPGKTPTGDLEGLLFGDVKRYLTDLGLQLELWAYILELERTPAKLEALSKAVHALHAWQDRHGFRDRYHDTYYYSRAHPAFAQAFRQLGTPEAEATICQLDMLTGPQHGRTLSLIKAMDSALTTL